MERNDWLETLKQEQYDFDTATMSQMEIRRIKQVVKEKRVDYALAPIGVQIFDFIRRQYPEIHFEAVEFDSENIDGMLYISTSGSNRAYIVLNSAKPLVNQIFTTAHELYHYIEDYARIKERPYICDFTQLTNNIEKCASRFAAELLLPETALENEIEYYKVKFNLQSEVFSFVDYATIAIILTVKYQLPLKAVIYRLAEEKYIDGVERYIEEYDFIKEVLKEVNVVKHEVDVLYSNENPFIKEDRVIYRQMETAYLSGNVSREELLQDAKELNLDEMRIRNFLEEIEEDDSEDDEEMFAYLNQRWGR